MAHRTAVQGVLHGFLGTYASRYSDYDGYYLFGFLAQTCDPQVFNLLQSPLGVASTPAQAAAELAQGKFKEQLEKAGLATNMVREATLQLRWSDEGTYASVNGRSFPAKTLSLSVVVTMDNGRRFVAEQSGAVMPHDPAVTFKSVRAHGA